MTGVLVAAVATEVASAAPRVFLLDSDALVRARQLSRAGDEATVAAVAHLLSAADEVLTAGPFSVVDKSVTPPSGDKHDYMSLAPYWWPDPAAADGRPYIRRDGQRNPEVDRVPDNRNFSAMATTVETLALASYLAPDEQQADRYAARAALLLDVWFLDESTRMNPHLAYAQAVRGENNGRGIGIIETRFLPRLVDALGLLAQSPAWTPERRHGLEAWCGDYLTWLRTSDHGQDEAKERNNHGTYYDLQVASLALFVGQHDLAREVLSGVGDRRIAAQIAPDGRQPLELDRTRAWTYSVMNLEGMFALARLGDSLGIDLWRFETSDGRSIRRALDYLIPYAAGKQAWPYPQIDGRPISLHPSLLRLAAAEYPDGPFASMVEAESTAYLPAGELWRSPLLPAHLQEAKK